MDTIKHDFQQDIDDIQAIDQVPKILNLCARSTKMRFVAVTRVTEDRWITCASKDDVDFGLGPGDELPVATTICDSIRDCGEMVVIDDVLASDEYRDHHTPAMYGFRSYISVPIIRVDGSFFGTLCAIDAEPKHLGNAETIDMFQLYAELIALQLDRQDEMRASKALLKTEQETAKLREEFIAVVGHDLRNPLAALSSGLRMVQKSAAPNQALLFEQMRHALHRMDTIIDNLLDFARGRLGTGVELFDLKPIDLDQSINEIVDEIKLVTKRDIQITTALPDKVVCDPQRIGQLISNLLSNAVTHGCPENPIHVRAKASSGYYRIEVENRGETIPAAIMESLFQPFRRGGSASRNGLGLGLFISNEIAKAHHGTLSATSRDGVTTFAFEMPVS